MPQQILLKLFAKSIVVALGTDVVKGFGPLVNPVVEHLGEATGQFALNIAPQGALIIGS